MKQKLVVKVCMNCEKCHSKALKIAVSLRGVESASLKGDDKSQIEVTGEGVDPVQLICLLRRKMRQAELVSVSAVSSGGGGDGDGDGGGEGGSKGGDGGKGVGSGCSSGASSGDKGGSDKSEGNSSCGHSTCDCGSVKPPAVQYVCIPPCYVCEVPYYHEPGYCSFL